MINFIIRYWIEFIFGLIISILGFIYKQICDHYKMIISTKNGVKVLLKNEIIKYYHEALTKNTITLFEKETLLDLYREYKQLGGNGLIENLIEKIDAIPLNNGGD